MNILTHLPYYQHTKTREVYPLSLDMIKRHLRLDNDFRDDDDYITELLYAATQLAENYINKAIAKTLNVLRIDDFSTDWVKIYEGNFISVESVKDKNDVSLGSILQTSVHEDYFTIEWNGAISADPLYISFYTGYNENATPELIKQAILIKIADLYDNQRSSLNWSGMTDSKVFETLLNNYVQARF